MTGIVDYGVGNLFSLRSSLGAIGNEHIVTSDPEELRKADRIILPGVGAFADAADKLRTSGLWDVMKERASQGVPVLGICLGMQMLFEDSSEYGLHEGLGLIEGHVCPLRGVIPDTLKVPHIGWNKLTILRSDPFFTYFPKGGYVYYVHSYYATQCEGSLLAVSEYAVDVPGVVRSGNVYGTQFHPEKSGDAGLALLKAFTEMEG